MSWRDFQKAIFLRIVSLKARYMTNDDDDELFLCYGWPTKGIWPYFQLGPLSEILNMANLRHAPSRVWTCAEPEFRVSWRCAVVIIITPWRYVTFLSFLCICNERTLSTFVDASLWRCLKYIFPENFNSLSEKLIILWLKIVFLNFPNVCNTASYFWTCLFIVLTETSC